ncbi:MAG: DUF222 domain-containing protein [Streptosporangiales bacterium]|nr:DUF222 domain-containing protein [Streptosporangiales bacterium]
MDSNSATDIDQLRRIADRLAEGPAPIVAAAAMEQAEELYAAIDRLEAAAAARVRAVDAAGQARAEGYTSTVAWLRESCAMRGSRAAERVLVARQLRRLPETAARFAAGTMGYCAAAVVARVVRNLDEADTARAEPILVDAADGGGPDQAAILGRRIHNILHPDGGLPDSEKQFARRWLKIDDLLDGMGRIDALLDPELKNRLRAALDPLAKPAGPDDPRTAGQRNADALDALLRGRQHTHMTVVVDLGTLAGGATPGILPDGSPIPAEDARRIAQNAGLSRVIVGPDSLPLDVGREHRLVTPAIRKALEVRDRGCVVEGCTMPAAWCEADHVQPWFLGGQTSLANTALCCPAHNRFKNRHPDRVEITRHPGGKITYRIQRTHRRNTRPSRDGPHRQAA